MNRSTAIVADPIHETFPHSTLLASPIADTSSASAAALSARARSSRKSHRAAGDERRLRTNTAATTARAAATR